MDRPVLEVKQLNSWYKDHDGIFVQAKQKKQVLKDVSFTVSEGEIVGLVGESGSGKSTLAKCVMGIVRDKSGAVIHHSEHPQMVFQDPYSSLNPSKKIGWILEESLRLHGKYPAKERIRLVIGMLERVGLSGEIADRYPRQLSGGQRQRVCIGAALMQEPKLLVADEAVSALDVTIQAQVIDLLLNLHREMGLAILFISHDLRVVYRISDRVLIMKDGRIVESGSAQQVYFEPEQDYTRSLLKAAGIVEWEVQKDQKIL